MRLQALEGWRGLTCLLVVIFHLYVAHALFFQPWLRQLEPVLEFFFIVSGFVMALGFSARVKDGPSFWGFVVRRFGRVFPLHWIMLGLLLLIPLARLAVGTPLAEAFGQSLSLNSLPSQLVLLQTWSPDLARTWNYPAWTLSGELCAYLLMALILVVTLGPATRWALALVVLAVAGAFFLRAEAGSAEYNVVTISRAVFGFFVGFLLHDLWRWFPLRGRLLLTVLELLAAAGFVWTLYNQFEGPAYFANHAVFALLIYVFAHDGGALARVFAAPPLMWLGKVSFSIYMFHGVVVTWLYKSVHTIEARAGVTLTKQAAAPGGEMAHLVNLPGAGMNDLLAGAYLAIVLAGGWLIHWHVEEPSRRYFAKLGARIEEAKSVRGGAETEPARG